MAYHQLFQEYTPPMTMLDRMRRHRNWLKWSLALVCLAFVIFYIPDFLEDTGAGAAPGEVIADVDGREITAGEFRRVYQNRLQSYRAAYGATMNEQLLKQLGIDQQILQQMVDEQASVAEAQRLGLRVSDEEVRERLVRIPSFQENGQFIGEQRYRQLLRMQRPPLSPAEFEDNLRRGLLTDKLRGALTDWITVSDTEIEREHRRRNEKVKVELVALQADKFRGDVAATDQEVSAHYQANKNSYKAPEKRKIRFVLVDTQALRMKTQVPAQDVERYYNENIQQYSTPEQIRASHVLLKTEGKQEADVRKQAEDVLAKARGGADFAQLATKLSEDEVSAKQGGDLDYFGRGRMVREFEEAAFALQPGQISDIVKTQYGFHIIKLTDRKAGATRSLDEVRQQILEQLKWERAQAQSADVAAAIESEVRKPADLDTAAKTRGLRVQETGFFAREEPIAGVGPAPEVASTAFELELNSVSGAVRAPQGFVVLAVTQKQDPYVPQLQEVRDRVREDVVKKKALDVARQKAASVAATLKSAADFAAAAKAAGLEPRTSELVARGAALPDVGISPAVEQAAFTLPAGAVSDPISAGNAVAIVKVIQREPPPAFDAAAKDSLRSDLLNDRRSRFFASYMTKAKERMKIRINRETLKKVVA
jgi:peptidyl-prolyl cis-trans isomerase D